MTTYTLFGQAAHTVGNVGANQGNGGLNFTVDVPGTIGAIWTDSSGGMTGLPTSTGIYNSGATLLASNGSPSWSGAFNSGWIRAGLTPLAVVPGVTYQAVVFGPIGSFGFDTGYSWPVSNGPLHSAAGDTQGWYNIGAAMAYAGSQVSGWNWWIDVEFTPAAGGSPYLISQNTGFF